MKNYDEFLNIWPNNHGDKSVTFLPKRPLQAPELLQDDVMKKHTKSRIVNRRLKALFHHYKLYSWRDGFSKQSHKYMEAFRALDPHSETFLDSGKVKPFLDLTKTPINEAEFPAAHQLF
ncbi:hypothetical protein AMECASPLE_037952 [Ameca splendens]|uniref:Uncharacterized protein n=1 Tax=Ameca splendens TaxID=208324 RepID=A0ABV0XL48_9TELE